MRAMFQAMLVLVLLAAVAPSALAEQSQNPNGAPLRTMTRARSYVLVNRSSDVVVAAKITMTNGDVRDLTWSQPVQPQEGRDIAVPIKDCMQSVSVKLKSGRELKTGGAPDCRLTRITVTNSAIDVGNSASNRPPNE